MDLDKGIGGVLCLMVPSLPEDDAGCGASEGIA